jgi:hypothetical protein
MQIHSDPRNFIGVPLLVHPDAYKGGRYDRFQLHTVYAATAINTPFDAFYLQHDNPTALQPGVYRLYVALDPNGPWTERAQFTAVGGETGKKLVGAFGDEPDGPIFIKIERDGGGYVGPVYGAYLDRNGQAKDAAHSIIQSGNYEWTHGGGHHVILVEKAQFGFSAAAVKPYTVVPFNTTKTRNQISRVNLTPHYGGAPRRPFIDNRGIINTCGKHPYQWSDLVASRPRQPLADGPRGQGTTQFITALRAGRNGKWYFCDPWRFGFIDSTGAVFTLIGLRDREPLKYWGQTDAPDTFEVVGNWDASIPADKRFPLESWGFAWWPRTLELDPSAPPQGGEQPHVGPGPVCFICDRHGYILKAQFNATVRDEPAKVTRFIAAGDPWSIECIGDVLYVAERSKHRISKWSAVDGAYLGDLVTGVAMGQISQDRVWTKNMYQTARTKNLVAPEGMLIQDGWCYVASLAMREVRRFKMDDPTVYQTCLRIPDTIANATTANFAYIALSDGTFFPRGTLFLTTWNLSSMGVPWAYIPTPGPAYSDGVVPTHSKFSWSMNGDRETGPGDYGWQSTSYPAACAVGNGMLAVGTAMHGVTLFMARAAGEPLQTLDIAWGPLNRLIHGPQGAGALKLNKPWGVSTAQDNYLRVHGHDPATDHEGVEDMAVIAELQAQLQAAQNLTAQLQAESDAKDQQIATLTAENAALKSRASEVDQLAKQIDAKNPDA